MLAVNLVVCLFLLLFFWYGISFYKPCYFISGEIFLLLLLLFPCEQEVK